MKIRMPITRQSITHKAVIHSAEGRIKFFITVGLYEDGQPGEIFITHDEAGGTLDGYSNAWAITVSMLLQEGVLLSKLVEKFSYQNFEPSGRTDCPVVWQPDPEAGARQVETWAWYYAREHVTQINSLFRNAQPTAERQA